MSSQHGWGAYGNETVSSNRPVGREGVVLVLSLGLGVAAFGGILMGVQAGSQQTACGITQAYESPASCTASGDRTMDAASLALVLTGGGTVLGGLVVGGLDLLQERRERAEAPEPQLPALGQG